MTKRNIVIPLDGSDFSRRILPHIRKTFDSATTRLHLIHVAEYPPGQSATPPPPVSLEYMSMPYFESSQDAARSKPTVYPDQAQESTRDMLKRNLQTDVRSLERDGYEVVEAIRFGEASEEIVAYATKVKAEAIAMTTHGRTGLSRLLFGSVAEQILCASPVPVMLLRPFAK